MIGIYKITNKINGKAYVGYAVDIKRRWAEHKSHSFSPTHITYNHAIHRAIRKYGIDNFNFEILEQCQEEELKDREIYWINKLQSEKNGYNMTRGGDGTANHWDRQINQYDLKGNFISTYRSIRYAARQTGIDHALIGRCCNHKANHAGGFIWAYDNELPIIPQNPRLRKRVGQYDLKTCQLIEIFNTPIEAARKLGKSSSTGIRNVCYGTQKSAYGYFWKYLD